MSRGFAAYGRWGKPISSGNWEMFPNFAEIKYELKSGEGKSLEKLLVDYNFICENPALIACAFVPRRAGFERIGFHLNIAGAEW